MKTQILLFAAVILALPLMAQVTTYQFNQSNTGPAAISGGMVLGDTTNNDNSFDALPIGFTFNFNTSLFDTLSVNTDGFLSFDNLVLSSYNPLSAGVSNNIVSVFGTNIHATGMSELRIETINTAPYRVCVIQWTNYTDVSGYDYYNFSIRLHETTNEIEFVYSSVYTSLGAMPVEVGLRGGDASEFISRTTYFSGDWNITSAAVLNTDACEITQLDFPVSGLTFTWRPPFDISLYYAVAPQPFTCYSANEPIVVEIKNLGYGTVDFSVNPLIINGSVSGTNPTTFATLYVNSGTLEPYQYFYDTLSFNYDMSAAGNYYFNFTAIAPGDNTSYNDTLNDTIHFNGLPSSSTFITSNPMCVYDYFGAHDTVWGGTPPFTFYWTDGGGFSDVAQYTGAYPGAATTYTVTATDSVGCTTDSYASVNPGNNTDITGTVLYGLTPVTAGTVYLYFSNCGCVGSSALSQYTSIDASGNFIFTAITHHDYLLKVKADSILYPNLIATYYGDTTLWDFSDTIHHDCAGNSVANFSMKAQTNTGTGTGYVSGTVYEGPNWLGAPPLSGDARNQGEPVPGLDVKMGHNPGGQIAIVTTTDSSGFYHFSNVDPGNYDIFVDVIGIGRTTFYQNVLIAGADTYSQMDYCADSTTVYTCLVTEINEHKQSDGFSVFPNPFTQNTSIRFYLNKTEVVKLEIHNVLGENVATIVNTMLPAGNHESILDSEKMNLNAGVYFVLLSQGDKQQVQKVVVY